MKRLPKPVQRLLIDLRHINPVPTQRQLPLLHSRTRLEYLEFDKLLKDFEVLNVKIHHGGRLLSIPVLLGTYATEKQVLPSWRSDARLKPKEKSEQ